MHSSRRPPAGKRPVGQHTVSLKLTMPTVQSEESPICELILSSPRQTKSHKSDLVNSFTQTEGSEFDSFFRKDSDNQIENDFVIHKFGNNDFALPLSENLLLNDVSSSSYDNFNKKCCIEDEEEEIPENIILNSKYILKVTAIEGRIPDIPCEKPTLMVNVRNININTKFENKKEREENKKFIKNSFFKDKEDESLVCLIKKTKAAKDSIKPVWNEEMSFAIESKDCPVEVSLKLVDGKKEQEIANLTLNLRSLNQNWREFERWFEMSNAETISKKDFIILNDFNDSKENSEPSPSNESVEINSENCSIYLKIEEIEVDA